MKRPIYTITALTYWVCPICAWRARDRVLFREHMKNQHVIGFNRIKLRLPKT